MRDDDAGEVPLQQIFERLDAVDVEMVGRLVEQQQIRIQREGQRERGAFALAARDLRRRRVDVHVESMQELGEARLDGVAVPLVMDFREPAAYRAATRAASPPRAAPAPARPARP